MSANKIALSSIANFVKVCAGSCGSMRKFSHLGAGTKAHLLNVESMLIEISTSLLSLATVCDSDIPENFTKEDISIIAAEENQRKLRENIDDGSPFLSEEEEKLLGDKLREALDFNFDDVE